MKSKEGLSNGRNMRQQRTAAGTSEGGLSTGPGSMAGELGRMSGKEDRERMVHMEASIYRVEGLLRRLLRAMEPETDSEKDGEGAEEK